MDKYVIRASEKETAAVTQAAGSSTNSTSRPCSIRKSDAVEVIPSCHNCKPIGDKHPEKKITNQESKIPRSFKAWHSTHKWLGLNSSGKAICEICTEASEKKLCKPTDSNALRSHGAFVVTGYDCWNNATVRFRKHEEGQFHRTAFSALEHSKKKTVIQCISDAQSKEMADSRTALEKLFTTVSALAQQGSAFRGKDNDEDSNLMILLKMRAADVPELDWWLKKTGYKWLHRDNINEMLDIMANDVIRRNLEEIKSAQYFSLIVDETADISRSEQVSISFRIVLPDFQIKEIFMGFYKTSNTKSETLVKIIRDVLLRFNLDISNLRGQCYDGAANMSGATSGVQTRLRQIEPRAVFIHCTAHTLNLVAQDAMKNVASANDFIGIAKDLIGFVRDSPKRLAIFGELRAASTSDNLSNLSPFCPTRWCMRVKSLKTILENFNIIQTFLEEMSTLRTDDTAKAKGFQIHLQDFDFYYLLLTTIKILERIEILNAQLQKSDLSINESHGKVKLVLDCLREMRRSGFTSLWENALNGVKEHELREPRLPRIRRAPKRLEQADAHVFANPEDYYRKIYSEIIDQVIASLTERFSSDTMEFLNLCENFVVGTKSDVTEIIAFYKDDFNKEQLLLYKSMFHDILSQRKVKVSSLKNVVEFARKDSAITELLPEYFKFIRTLLTIPASSCTAERSFSSLRRLKSCLRSTMHQSRLNNIAILHVHRELTQNLQMADLMNEFISRNSKRRATFAVNK